MKNGENSNARRNFLKGLGAIFLLAPMIKACQQKVAKFVVKLTGTNHILGHKLWAKDFPKPSEIIEIPYLIIGGGISGLSAARQFSKKGIHDFLLLEMENHVGGNSSNGENKYSKYPLGAHYLPLPNFHDKELLAFLEESRIITGYDGIYPIFDETQLSFDPDERLFYRNSWQEGLIPRHVNAQEIKQFERFSIEMEILRKRKGNDGKYWFDLPVDWSSNDKQSRDFDKMSMKEWLEQNHFDSDLLFTYVDYCCRDDFGFGIDAVSAWAGIHYFASRKFDATKEKTDGVLTWPEGNARLASHLKKYSEAKTLKNHLAYDISISNNKVQVLAYDDSKAKSVEIVAEKIVVCAPQFVNKYLLPNRKNLASEFTYAPWLLATLTLSDLGDNGSFPLSWDNVIHGSEGLGYIYDQHQSIGQLHPKKVITYYRSFPSSDTKKSRRQLYSKPVEYWEEVVFDDLKTAHPDIEEITESIHIHRLGHGMISPKPGFIWGKARSESAKNIGSKIYFAHSDLSGVSVFEEAFHQGIKAVNELLHETTLDS